MTRVTRHVFVPADTVFDALVDPYTYPEWLVGAKEIRTVDDGWPAVGTKFHHRVGLGGPLTVADSTEVLEIERPQRLVLEVRARPLGRARAEFHLTPVERDDGRPVTRIVFDEVPIGAIAPLAPVLDPLTRARNGASLNALVAYLNN